MNAKHEPEAVTGEVSKGTCASCGCTRERACKGGCSWSIEPTAKGFGLCSRCVNELLEDGAVGDGGWRELCRTQNLMLLGSPEGDFRIDVFNDSEFGPRSSLHIDAGEAEGLFTSLGIVLGAIAVKPGDSEQRAPSGLILPEDLDED